MILLVHQFIVKNLFFHPKEVQFYHAPSSKAKVENERQTRKGDNDGVRSNVRMGWLSHVDENMSLTALKIGIGIGFGGVVVVFMLWEKARHWVVPPNTKLSFLEYNDIVRIF